MTLSNIARVTLLACGLASLAACTAFRTVDNELDTASSQLATENVTLSADGVGVPKAEITPRGEFLIDGKPVALTTQQRGEVLSYRAQYLEIAQEGIAIGKQGVEVGRRAMAPMVFAALFGASDESIEADMNQRLAGVREATAQLCDRLPELMATGRQLATDLPAFEPYATLTAKKIDECRQDALNGKDEIAGSSVGR